MPRKLLVLIVLILGISSFFVAIVPLTPQMAVVSGIFVILFALPSYLALGRTIARKGVLTLFVLGGYALLLESLALAYGFPYGRFTYTDILGTKLFGLTPWTVALAYPPIILLAYWFVRRKSSYQVGILFGTALTATAIDSVLDPAAVALGFWRWDTPGFYYGVPLINFVGWLFSSFLAGTLLHGLLRRYTLGDGVAYSGMAILFFWTLVNAWLGQWLPVCIGTVLLYIFVKQLKDSPRCLTLPAIRKVQCAGEAKNRSDHRVGFGRPGQCLSAGKSRLESYCYRKE